MSEQDLISIRDPELRGRIDGLIERTNNVLKLTWIVRTAVEEYVTRLETQPLSETIAEIIATPRPALKARRKRLRPSDEPYNATSEITRAAERAITRKDAGKKTPQSDSPNRARGK